MGRTVQNNNQFSDGFFRDESASEVTIWHLVSGYLHKRKWELIYFFCCLTIMVTVMGLSSDPRVRSEGGYGIVLCLMAGAGFLAADFYSYQRAVHRLLRQIQCVGSELVAFEESTEPYLRCWQTLALSLQQGKIDAISEKDMARKQATDYYSMWVHQIKTPIAAMNLLLCQAGENPDSVSVPELWAQLFQIEQYVEMALTFLRTESDATDYVFAPVCLENVVKKAVKKYAMQFIQKKIALDLKEMKDTVLTDEKWLLFVLEQIISNALKYTGQGSVTICSKQRGGFVELKVSDTGIGIAQEDLPRIFENGFTGYNGRLGRKSSGIGLYLCKRILTRMGHDIRLESEAGEGTCVIICFPSPEDLG